MCDNYALMRGCSGTSHAEGVTIPKYFEKKAGRLSKTSELPYPMDH